MQTIVKALPYFLIPLFLSVCFVPFARFIGLKLGVYSVENERSVHHGKMVRLGGLAIYLAFMISMAIFMKADYTLNGILIGGSIVFIGGLLDDMYDLSPLVKVCFQVAGAMAAIFIGRIFLTDITLPFGISLHTGAVSLVVSFVWIVGVTNAINLIDGLDGLSDGVCFIVVCTIGMIGYLMGRRDIAILSLILAGSILGLLPFNFHPAKIFMGDCGALFLGFTLACLSLLGFKTTTFITLGFPIIILFVPISDTLIAIVRRKISGHKISEADRSHLHHILMYKLQLGHRNAVIALYIFTLLCGACAVLSYTNEKLGLILMVILLFCFELFIEATGMINSKFHPLLGLSRRLTGYPRKKAPPEIKHEELDNAEPKA